MHVHGDPACSGKAEARDATRPRCGSAGGTERHSLHGSSPAQHSVVWLERMQRLGAAARAVALASGSGGAGATAVAQRQGIAAARHDCSGSGQWLGSSPADLAAEAQKSSATPGVGLRGRTDLATGAWWKPALARPAAPQLARGIQGSPGWHGSGDPAWSNGPAEATTARQRPDPGQLDWGGRAEEEKRELWRRSEKRERGKKETGKKEEAGQGLRWKKKERGKKKRKQKRTRRGENKSEKMGE